jgi:hypothetical protein
MGESDVGGLDALIASGGLNDKVDAVSCGSDGSYDPGPAQCRAVPAEGFCFALQCLKDENAVVDLAVVLRSGGGCAGRETETCAARVHEGRFPLRSLPERWRGTAPH